MSKRLIPYNAKILWYSDEKGVLRYIKIRTGFKSAKMENWINKLTSHGYKPLAIQSDSKIKVLETERFISDEVNINMIHEHYREILQNPKI